MHFASQVKELQQFQPIQMRLRPASRKAHSRSSSHPPAHPTRKVSNSLDHSINQIRLVSRLFDVQVAVISNIEAHPDSEKLFVCQVDMGAGTTCQVSTPASFRTSLCGRFLTTSFFRFAILRQVVTGLQKFYRAEELRGRQVAVIRNLKPAKLAGSVSEAMILAGAVHKEDGTEIVKVLMES